MRRLLASRWICGVAALLALALTLPSIGNGLGIDDHLLRARVLDEQWSAARAARDLFVFATPDHPGELAAQMARGEISWWAAPDLRWGFMRPVPALLHHAEFTAFGRGGAAWMHLHSVLWMAALAAAVALLYRRMFGATWVAGLAAVLYAIDDGHGFAVGWLSNRGAVMGACFAVLALVAHDGWCRERWRPGAVLGPLSLALALLCSEQMVAIAGYLVAYEIILHRVALRQRVLAFAPFAVLIVGWYVIRASLGYGSVGTGSYTDPVSEPVAFLGAALQRIPILAHSQLGPLPADLWEVVFVRRDLTWLMVALGVAALAILGLVLGRMLRADPVARFWAVGMGLALVAVCGAHPNDRHLLLVGIGGSALIARFLAAWVERREPAQHATVAAPAQPATVLAPLPLTTLAPRDLLPRRGATLAAIVLCAIHGVLAPIALPIRARIPGSVSRGVARIDALVPRDPALATQDLVIVSVPFKYLCNFASVVRRSNGGVSPNRWRCLGVTPDTVIATRPDAQTLVLRPALGYLRFFEDTNVRARRFLFAAGDRVELPDLTIGVRSVTADARPAEIEIRFAVPLEDPSLRWVVWRDGAYRAFTPPPVGGSVTIPAESFAFGDLLSDTKP